MKSNNKLVVWTNQLTLGQIEKCGLPKASHVFPQENTTYPPLVGLTPDSLSSSPRICKDRRLYAHIITKISRMDRLPNFLSNVAIGLHFARAWSSTINLPQI